MLVKIEKIEKINNKNNKSKIFGIGIQFFSNEKNENDDENQGNVNNSFKFDFSPEQNNEQSNEQNFDEFEEQEINFETGEAINSQEKDSIQKIIFKNLFDILEVFAHSIALMVIVFLFVVKFVTVDGTSMLYTLKDEDKLVIYNLFYTPESNDVIVINYKDKNELLVKRVIGVGGDTIKIDFDTWEIWVNGEYLEQPYLNENPEYRKEPMERGHLVDVDSDNCITFTVEEGKVFFLGDNRNHSSDSRVFGQLDISEILGKVIYRVYPFESAGVIK